VKREKVSDLSDFQSAGSGEREKITHHVSRFTHHVSNVDNPLTPFDKGDYFLKHAQISHILKWVFRRKK
jgi:hypothetical protein